MADETIDIKIREDGSREAIVNIRQIGVQADSTTAQVNNLNQTFTSTSRTTQQFGQQTQSATQSLQQMTQQSASATQQLQRQTQQTQSASQAIQQFAIGATVFNVVADSVGNLLSKLADIPNKVYDGLKAITSIQAEVDRLNVGFKFGAGGNSDLGAANLQYVNDLVQKLGLSLGSTADGFMKFAAATQNTALEGSKTRDVFTAISEAATVLHLNGQQVNGMFLALEQMVSKGTVSMEELRRQLGNYLPGTMKTAADAMGVTTAQLNKMVTSGQLLTDDFLPKFAQAIHEKYGGAVVEASESAQGSLNRLETAWTNLKRTFADSGLGEAAKGQLDILTEAINGVSQAMQRAKQEGSGFWGQFGAGLKSFGNWFVGGTQNSDQGLQQRIDYMNAQLQRNDLDKFQKGQLAYDLSQALAEQQARQKVLANSPGRSADALAALNAQDRAAAEVAQRDANNRLNSFVDGSGKGVSHLTRAEQEAKQLKEVQTQFETATKGFNQTSAEYLRAYDVFKAREQEIRDRFAKPGQRQAAAQLQNELGAELAVWKGVADSRIQMEQTEAVQLQTQRNEGLISEKDYATQLGDIKERSLIDQQIIAEKEAEIAGGRKQLAERQKYLAEANKLEQEIVKNRENTANQLAAIERQTRQAGTSALLSFNTFGDQRGRAAGDQLAAMTQGGEVSNLDRQLRQIEDRADKARLQVTQTATKLGTTNSKEYLDAISQIDVAEQALIQREQGYHDQRLALQRDWATGASKALQDYADKANNVAASVEATFSNAFTNMEDALTKFVTTGKLDFSTLAQSIIQDLVKMELRIVMSSALSSLFGSSFGMANLAPTAGPNTGAGVGYTFNSGSLAGTGAWATGGYTGDGGVNEVAGVVHKGEYVIKQDVVNQPGMKGYLDTLNATGAPPVSVVGRSYAGGGATSGGGLQMSVVINNNASDKVNATAKQSTDENGNPSLEVIIDSVESSLAGRMSQGRGQLYKATQNAFGLRSNPGMRS